MSIPRKVVDSLADGAEVIAAALTGETFNRVEKLLHKLARNNLQAEIASVGLSFLVQAVETVGPKLKEVNEQARAKNSKLRATLTQFKLDLEQGIAEKKLRTSK